MFPYNPNPTPFRLHIAPTITISGYLKAFAVLLAQFSPLFTNNGGVQRVIHITQAERMSRKDRQTEEVRDKVQS